MIDTLERVSVRLGDFRERIAASRPEPTELSRLVDEARAVLAAFESAEAHHVRLALGGGAAAFEFATAQRELARQREDFSAEVQGLSRRFGDRLEPRSARELGKIGLMARKAPLTTAADLEVIRAGRRERSYPLSA